MKTVVSLAMMLTGAGLVIAALYLIGSPGTIYSKDSGYSQPYVAECGNLGGEPHVDSDVENVVPKPTLYSTCAIARSVRQVGAAVSIAVGGPLALAGFIGFCTSAKPTAGTAPPMYPPVASGPPPGPFPGQQPGAHPSPNPGPNPGATPNT